MTTKNCGPKHMFLCDHAHDNIGPRPQKSFWTANFETLANTLILLHLILSHSKFSTFLFHCILFHIPQYYILINHSIHRQRRTAGNARKSSWRNTRHVLQFSGEIIWSKLIEMRNYRKTKTAISKDPSLETIRNIQYCPSLPAPEIPRPTLWKFAYHDQWFFAGRL